MGLGIREETNWFIPFDPEIPHLKIILRGKQKSTNIFIWKDIP